MLLLGLTGGIGSGKSTVSAGFAHRGAVVVDADAIVKELQRSGTPVFEAMVERFGASIVGSDGELDRAAVAAIVFNDKDALADLGAIVHPSVQAEIFRRVEEQRELDNVVILDVPLLVESGWKDLEGTIVVDLDLDVAVDRLVRFRGFDEADARARIANQVSREQRVGAGSFVIDNGGSMIDLEHEIDRAWKWIQSLR
ncbi:MAG: dephospho-CoA kinase [Microthrixaceae bacterium]